MPKFLCSYAFDTSSFCDFVVEAESEQEAGQIIAKEFENGSFVNVECDINWDNVGNHRVFVQTEIDEEEAKEETMMEDLSEFGSSNEEDGSICK
jgi:hypothetical protein